MKKKIILFIVSLFIFPLNILAKSQITCDHDEFSNLRKYASNINISYNYYLDNGEPYFNVVINNVPSNLYIQNEDTGQKYYYDDNNKGEIVISGLHNVTSLKFASYSNIPTCMDEALSIYYVSLPIYNKYADDPLCEENKNFRLCTRFLTSEVTREYFDEQIQEYIESKNKPATEEEKEEKKVKNFDSWQDLVIRYSPLAAILLIVLIVFIVQRRKKKNSFDFKL